jgi:hypothetical protein
MEAVAGLVDPAMLVEIEADAIVETAEAFPRSTAP